MKICLLIMCLVLSTSVAFASEDSLLGKNECKEIKTGIGYFLAVAGQLFDELEKVDKKKWRQRKSRRAA